MEHRSPKKGFWGAALSMSHILHGCLHKDAGRLLRCRGEPCGGSTLRGWPRRPGLLPPSRSTQPSLTASSERAQRSSPGEKRAGPAGAPLVLLLELTVSPAERGGAHPRVLSRDGRHGESLDCRPPGVRGIPSTDLSICFRGARCNGIGLRSSFCPGHR